jgi:hypothetical protein
VNGQVVGLDGKLLENASMISPIVPRSGLCRLDLQVNATPGESRGAFTALRYVATHGIVSDAKSVAERYRWEDGRCWNFDHQPVTQGTLVRLSSV